MKVLFTFGGLPHYNNYILSRLNSIDNLEIVVAVPDKGTKTLGDSVKEGLDGINFRVIYLKEKKAFYGNYYLDGLLETIKIVSPDIVVTIWPYVLNIVADFKLKRYLRKNNINLVIKEIPFDIPPYKDAIKYYESNYALRLNEDLEIKTKINLAFYLKHYFLREIRRYYYSRLIKASINYIDEAYTISPSYGLKKESVFISTNSPDTDLIFAAAAEIVGAEPILPSNPHRIIHVGRLVKWKRVHLILEALVKLKPEFPEIELIVIGKGKEESTLKQKVVELGLDANVKFVGGIYDYNQLGRYFKASSVYVLAGMGGLSINEAMAFGKPVICSIADGTEKRLVRNGYNGYYFKPDDCVDLASKIGTLLRDIQLIRNMGQNSLSIIKNEVNVYTVLKGYLASFNYVTGEKLTL